MKIKELVHKRTDVLYTTVESEWGDEKEIADFVEEKALDDKLTHAYISRNGPICLYIWDYNLNEFYQLKEWGNLVALIDERWRTFMRDRTEIDGCLVPAEDYMDKFTFINAYR